MLPHSEYAKKFMTLYRRIENVLLSYFFLFCLLCKIYIIFLTEWTRIWEKEDWLGFCNVSLKVKSYFKHFDILCSVFLLLFFFFFGFGSCVLFAFSLYFWREKFWSKNFDWNNTLLCCYLIEAQVGSQYFSKMNKITTTKSRHTI